MVVDLSKVSKAIQTFVKDVQKMEGDKKSIDTQTEYNKLSDYLAGNKDKMNTHEKEFIEGFMIEYTTSQAAKSEEAKQRDLEDNATTSTKDLVKKVAKMYDNHKKIDNDLEAQTLAQVVNNPKSDLSKADRDYIRNVLIKSGYERYLEPDTNQKAEANPPKIEEGEKGAKKVAPEANSPVPTNNKPKVPNNKPKVPNNKPKVPNNPPKVPDNPPKVPDKKPEAENKSTPSVITEAGRNSGNSCADTIINEVHSHYADNDKIRKALRQVDSHNAFTVVGRIITQTGNGINQEVFSVSDTFNKIRYKDTLHVMEALLQQAAEAGLQDTPQYKTMEKEITYVTRKVSANPNVDPDKGEQRMSDKAIKDLYNVMAKKIK